MRRVDGDQKRRNINVYVDVLHSVVHESHVTKDGADAGAFNAAAETKDGVTTAVVSLWLLKRRAATSRHCVSPRPCLCRYRCSCFYLFMYVSEDSMTPMICLFLL